MTMKKAAAIPFICLFAWSGSHHSGLNREFTPSILPPGMDRRRRNGGVLKHGAGISTYCYGALPG
ncbi:MAG: hypothetical protein FJ020_03560 [Chloroflexi bacterium]|nr:hypothetical protein [Chloroflexota bacterium]